MPLMLSFTCIICIRVHAVAAMTHGSPLYQKVPRYGLITGRSEIATICHDRDRVSLAVNTRFMFTIENRAIEIFADSERK